MNKDNRLIECRKQLNKTLAAFCKFKANDKWKTPLCNCKEDILSDGEIIHIFHYDDENPHCVIDWIINDGFTETTLKYLSGCFLLKELKRTDIFHFCQFI